MRKVIITMTAEEFDKLYGLVVKARNLRLRPAVKLLDILATARWVDEDEPAPEDASQEPPAEPQEPPGPQHKGMRPVRGSRQP